MATIARASDPRIERTKALLWSALVSLIEESGYESIFVSHITERARINRSTFYRYFEDKDDLFRQGCCDLFDSIFKKLEKRLDAVGGNMAPWPVEYFDHLFQLIDDERQTFLAIGGEKGSPDFGAIIRDKIDLFFIERRLPAQAVGSENSAEAELNAVAVSSMLVGLIERWLIRPGQFTRQLVCKVYRDALLNGLPPYRDATR